MTHLETKLKIGSWDEKPYRELPDGRKFTRADVTLSVADKEIEAEATSESLTYYAADGTATYVGLMHIDGKLGGRSGSFVLHNVGRYDGTEASGRFEIVPGSGTGELAGISGSGSSVSTHADYPNMPLTLDYEL